MNPVAVKKLHGRLVVTQSGSKLGNLKDIVFDADTARVLQFVVHHGLIAGTDLLIAADEVVEIREDAIVVKDTFVKDATPAMA